MCVSFTKASHDDSIYLSVVHSGLATESLKPVFRVAPTSSWRSGPPPPSLLGRDKFCIRRREARRGRQWKRQCCDVGIHPVRPVGLRDTAALPSKRCPSNSDMRVRRQDATIESFLRHHGRQSLAHDFSSMEWNCPKTIFASNGCGWPLSHLPVQIR